MTESILRVCPGCGRYTFRAKCPECGSATRTPHPPRFDPNDRYGKYRRLLFAAAAGSSEGGG